MKDKYISEKKRKEEIAKKLDKVKENYEDFYFGKMDKHNLKEVIVNELKLKDAKSFETVFSKAAHDKEGYTDLVKNLNILTKHDSLPRFSQQQMKESTIPKFRKYKKTLPEYKPQKDQTHEDHFRTNALRYVKGELDTYSFRDMLRKNNIEDSSGAVDKLIRQKDSGISIKFDDLIMSIRKNKSDQQSHMHQSSKVELHPEPTRKYYMENEIKAKHLDKNVVLAGNLKTPLYMQKKRLYDNNQNYKSRKDCFDWEENVLTDINNGSQTTKSTTKSKFIFNSNIFENKEEVKDTTNKINKEKKFGTSGNILTWSGQPEAKASTNRTLSRSYKNTESMSFIPPAKPQTAIIKKKESLMQKVSEDNPLVTAGIRKSTQRMK